MKILISDSLSSEGIDILKKEKKFQVDVAPGLSKEELIKKIPEYDVLLVRSGTKVTKDVIEAGKKLKVIGRAGEGLDNVDVEVATKKGIIVMNTPGGSTISAAEHTISLLLSLSRNIPQANNSLKQKKWERGKFQGVEVYNKILGIIGLGKIGQEVAKRANSFGMKIIAYDPFISTDLAKNLNIELVSLDELISSSDYITIHTPLTKETKHLISEKELKKMKKDVRIINCARGGIIDERALYNALKEGKIAGAALDVFEDEPLKDSPLLELDNVITTPHLGASTKEAQEKVSLEIAKQVLDALKNGVIRNAVNIPQVDKDVLPKIKPYLSVSEKLGSFLAQISPPGIEKIEIYYKGEITNYPLSSLTVSFLKGLLEKSLEESVNYVNASFIAKNRGIKVVESKTQSIEDFGNLISCLLYTKKERRSVSGTILSSNNMRIVEIDGFSVDVSLGEISLICYNIDKPGVIGKVGTILGENNINIANLQYGRKDFGGKAIIFLKVDCIIPEKVLDKIRGIKEIKEVKLVKL